MAPHCLVILPINEKGSRRCLEIELFAATVLTLRASQVRFSLAKKILCPDYTNGSFFFLLFFLQQQLHSIESYACIIPRRVKNELIK